jgi:hypothetical protein
VKDSETRLRAEVDQAVAAWRDRAPMPMASPSQRAIAAIVPRIYCDAVLATMRSRLRRR